MDSVSSLALLFRKILDASSILWNSRDTGGSAAIQSARICKTGSSRQPSLRVSSSGTCRQPKGSKEVQDEKEAERKAGPEPRDPAHAQRQRADPRRGRNRHRGRYLYDRWKQQRRHLRHLLRAELQARLLKRAPVDFL